MEQTDGQDHILSQADAPTKKGGGKSGPKKKEEERGMKRKRRKIANIMIKGLVYMKKQL